MTEEDAFDHWVSMPIDRAKALIDVALRILGPWEDYEPAPYQLLDREGLPGDKYWQRRTMLYGDRVAVISWSPPDDPDEVPRWHDETEDEYRAGFERQRSARPMGWFYWRVDGGENKEMNDSGVATLAEAVAAVDDALRRTEYRAIPSGILFEPPKAKPLPWAGGQQAAP